jgi:glycine hydroxymethyltransferase
MKYLQSADPEMAALIVAERERQNSTLELIASENHVSLPVLEAMGSVLTDKYAEGYPGHRYYCGNSNIDAIEQLAIDRAKKLFGAEYANVQPHSGTSANLGVYMAVLKPGQKIMGMDLAHGGHLSHGLAINLSGMAYSVCHYGLRQDTEMLDMNQVRQRVLAERPDILVCGASAYPRQIDFQAFGEIAREAGCPLMSDIAHIAGLVIGGVHPNPMPHSDFVTTTNHKTLRGPRGGIILAKAKYAKAIDKAIFPGLQGGPLMHVIAAKAVAFAEAMQPGYRAYAGSIVANAKALASGMMDKGWRLVSGGTDNHMMLVDLRSRLPDMTGRTAALMLEQASLICNWNLIPFDPRPPSETSGIRLGTPALTTRGLNTDDMRHIADWIDRVLTSGGDQSTIARVRADVMDLCKQHPVPNYNL